jgi:hypothetical protein
MSALGQKQTYAVQQPMSALPPKADMCGAARDVRFGPKEIGSGPLLDLFPNKNSDAFTPVDWAFVGRRSYN